MSLFDRLRDETEREEESEQPATDGGDATTDDPFADEFEDGGEFDEMGNEFGDDGFGDLSMMDEGDDEYATEELERRVDDVETELASISSTVNTIRSENEEISNTVEDVEENVRKLLDVYEMVTRGINPFTDDIDTGGAGAVGGGSLGLFDDEADEEETEDLDEKVADADADSFFDDELEDQEGGLDTDSNDAEDTEGGSFADLKAEYESGDAEWDEQEMDIDTTTQTEVSGDETDKTEESKESDEIDTELQYAEHTLSDGPDAEKPYLRGSFDGYIADLLVLEWLEYLVDASGKTATERAISYYESIRWIDEDAGEQLRAFIDGFDADEEGEVASLTIANHTQSLRYICQLSSSTAAPVILDGWKENSRGYRR